MIAEPGVIETSAGPMAYVEQGEGPPVVLLHGFPTSSFLWRRFVPLLATRFRTIAPDLIGYGRSAKPSEGDLSIRAQAGYVRELLRALAVEAPRAVVGHDIGGGVAQLLAFEGEAEAVVLIDAVTFDSWPIEGVKMIQGTEPEQATDEFVENVIRIALDLGIGHSEMLTDDLVRAYTEPFTDDGGPEAFLRAVRGIDGEGLIGTEDRVTELGERLLVLWGEDDPYQESELAIRLADLVPGATVALLPGCSHFLPEDAPDTVAPLVYEWLRVRFLKEPHHHAGDVGVHATTGRPVFSPEELMRPGEDLDEPDEPDEPAP